MDMDFYLDNSLKSLQLRVSCSKSCCLGERGLGLMAKQREPFLY